MSQLWGIPQSQYFIILLLDPHWTYFLKHYLYYKKDTKVGRPHFGYQIWFCTRLMMTFTDDNHFRVYLLSHACSWMATEMAEVSNRVNFGSKPGCLTCPEKSRQHIVCYLARVMPVPPPQSMASLEVFIFLDYMSQLSVHAQWLRSHAIQAIAEHRVMPLGYH